MRLFFACFLTGTSARLLSERVPEVAGMKRVPAENLHVTLRFLGSIPPDRVSDVRTLAAGLPGEALTVPIREVVGFPGPHRPRALVARLEDPGSLRHWYRQLADSFPAQDGPSFDPHVTLGRFRTPGRIPDLRALAGLSLDLQPPALYRSETLPEGARYTRLPAL